MDNPGPLGFQNVRTGVSMARLSSVLADVCCAPCTRASWAGWEVPGRCAEICLLVSRSQGKTHGGHPPGAKLPTSELRKNVTTCVQAMGGVEGGALLWAGAASLGRTEGCLAHPATGSASFCLLPGLFPHLGAEVSP